MIRVEAQGGGKTFASRGTPGVPARNIVHSACRPGACVASLPTSKILWRTPPSTAPHAPHSVAEAPTWRVGRGPARVAMEDPQ